MTSLRQVLELRDIAKSFEGNRVLKGVSLTVRPGTIHALVGENGAGKSTLMNVLFGMPVIRETGGYQGQVLLEGSEARFGSPAEAPGGRHAPPRARLRSGPPPARCSMR